MQYKISILALFFFSLQMKAQTVYKSMLRLPDTGQIVSYTTTFGEDNDFNIYPPLFIQNNNGTVIDSITGLVWQKLDGGEMTIENATIYCDTLTLGNYNNWRLPNAHEAFSILNHQLVNPALNVQVFTTTAAEYWWTSDRQANDSSKVWATNAGGGIGNHPKSETISAGGPKKFHVRAVRDAIAPLAIPNQYTDNGNNTITDHLTDLIWQKAPFSDSLSWEQSLTYADTLTTAGFNDWRLPNIKELQSLNDETRINPSINSTYFNVTNVNKYWSSTTLPNQTAKAWYLNNQFGITTYDNKTVKHNLICVRSNQSSTAISTAKSITQRLFPNPFSNYLRIINSTGNEIFELINLTGSIIYSGQNIEMHDFSQLENGIYFLRIIDNSITTIKLIKN
jgi:hypothetical protein